MAIQQRRGNIADLDISKLVQGEPFICLDKDANGRFYAGIATAPNQVMRLAEFNEMLDVLTDCEQYRDEAEASKDAAADSESNAEAWAVGERGGTPVPSSDVTYENNSKYYAEQAGDYWGYIDDAVDFLRPTVSIDFTTGQLMYSGAQLMFWIDQPTGMLMWNVTGA
jgi:hypothetical protein